METVEGLWMLVTRKICYQVQGGTNRGLADCLPAIYRRSSGDTITNNMFLAITSHL